MSLIDRKDGNPKDLIGVKKWGQFSTIPMGVMAEVGASLFEGAAKYGRHNYRAKGVMASVYVDAIMRHLMQWWEGEDIDKESGQSHLTKLIAGAIVLRDAMLQDNWVDDRPPKSDLDTVRRSCQETIDKIFEENPEFVKPYTEENRDEWQDNK